MAQNWLTISLDLIVDAELKPRLSELHVGCHGKPYPPDTHRDQCTTVHTLSPSCTWAATVPSRPTHSALDYPHTPAVHLPSVRC